MKGCSGNVSINSFHSGEKSFDSFHALSIAIQSVDFLNDVLLQFFRLFLVQQRNSPITMIRESIPNSFQLSGDTCSASTSNAASTSHRKASPAVFLVIQKVLHYLLSGWENRSILLHLKESHDSFSFHSLFFTHVYSNTNRITHFYMVSPFPDARSVVHLICKDRKELLSSCNRKSPLL